MILRCALSPLAPTGLIAAAPWLADDVSAEEVPDGAGAPAEPPSPLPELPDAERLSGSLGLPLLPGGGGGDDGGGGDGEVSAD